MTPEQMEELNELFTNALVAFNATERLLQGINERLNYLVSSTIDPDAPNAVNEQLKLIKPDTSALRNFAALINDSVSTIRLDVNATRNLTSTTNSKLDTMIALLANMGS